MKEWTIMVYMAGDNDLSEDMSRKLVELQDFFQNGSSLKNIGLLVYFDGGNPLTGTKLFNFTKSTNPASVGEVKFPDAADPKSVFEFVKWCVEDEKVTAENYALLFSGHGDGFQRTAFMRDMSSFDFMTVVELKKILKKINKKILHRKKLPLLAFDSCVMSMMEVINEFTDSADMFTGSEGYMPTTGLSYTRFVEGLGQLDLKGQIAAEDISELIVESARAHNENYAALQMRSLDMNVIDLTPQTIKFAVKSIDKLGEVLVKALYLPDPTPASKNLNPAKDGLIRDAVEKVLLTAHWRCQTFLFDQAIDVLDFCKMLRYECFKSMSEKDLILKAMNLNFMTVNKSADEIKSVEISASITKPDEKTHETILSLLRRLRNIVKACDEVIGSVEDCIIQSCYSGPDYRFANGLAVFFPWSFHTFEMTRYKFKEYGFACRGGNAKKLNPWYLFLETYLKNTARPEISMRLDPPPRGMLASENQYKEYFMRIKNLSLEMDVISGGSSRKNRNP